MSVKSEILKNKNCFISGATGGIGKAIAVKMAQNKCNLFLTSTDSVKLNELKQEIESLYGKNLKIAFEPGDLDNIDDVKRIIVKAIEYFDHVDILVNCAGIFPVKTLLDTDLKEFERCFNINVRAAFVFYKEFVQFMIQNRWGRIVNIGSSSAYAGFKETSVYCASKHALLGLSRALHDEHKEYGIRTFCVSPGSVKTEMGKLVKNQNYDTFIDPQEIADYISFIISFNDAMISDEIRLNRMVIE